MSREAILILTQIGKEPRPFTLRDEAWLGRAEDCAIQLSDRAISRRHAVIRWSGESIEVENKSTFAPLKVNGIECTHAILCEGDQVGLGPYQVQLAFPKIEQTSENPKQQKVSPEPIPTLDPLAPTKVEAMPLSPGEHLDSPNSLQPDPAEVAKPDLGLEMSLEDSQGNHQQVSSNEGSEDPLSSLSMESSGDSDDRTKMTPAAQVVAKLLFKPGDSNHEEYVLQRDEVSIGRSQNCDIVLSDKKASRKNTLIRRVGVQFTIKDLDSVNGTILNGITVSTAELTGDDVIQIGDVQFRFKVVNSEYEAKASQFEPVPTEPEEMFQPLQEDGGLQIGSPMDDLAPVPGLAQESGAPDQSMGGISGLNGVVGLEASKSSGRNPLQRFFDLPQKTKLLGGLGLMVAIYVIGDNYQGFFNQPQVKSAPRAQKSVAARPSGAPTDLSFEKLPIEQRNFVENQHNLAFDYYKNSDYDKAIFEIEKIFNIISDYKDSREIQRYAKEGKRKLESIAEEKRKKEEEQQLKERVSSLVDEAKNKMEEREYDSARELFTQILALDPDNSSVIAWRKTLDGYDEERKIQRQLLQVRREINLEGWRIYRQGLSQSRLGRYSASIVTFKKTLSIGVTDKKLKSLVHARIQKAREQIAKLRDPIFKDAEAAEAANDLANAFKLYKKSTEIDSQYRAGFDAMNRIRGALHDRAKTIYTEAVIAENYSDFENAERLFKSCLDTAPADDIYHDRAARKLAKFVSLQALRTPASPVDPAAGQSPPSTPDGSQAQPVSPDVQPAQPTSSDPANQSNQTPQPGGEEKPK